MKEINNEQLGWLKMTCLSDKLESEEVIKELYLFLKK